MSQCTLYTVNEVTNNIQSSKMHFHRLESPSNSEIWIIHLLSQLHEMEPPFPWQTFNEPQFKIIICQDPIICKMTKLQNLSLISLNKATTTKYIYHSQKNFSFLSWTSQVFLWQKLHPCLCLWKWQAVCCLVGLTLCLSF